MLYLAVFAILMMWYFVPETRPKRKKSDEQTARDKLTFAKALRDSGVPTEKIRDILFDGPAHDQAKQREIERKNEREAYVASDDKLAGNLYGMFISKGNAGGFLSFFSFVPEYAEYFAMEFFLFRYFLISFLGEFYMGSNEAYRAAAVKFDNSVAEWSVKEIALGDGRDEFMSLSALRVPQYRRIIPPDFDVSRPECVAGFTARVFDSILDGAYISSVLTGGDFASGVIEFLTGEYFVIREKIESYAHEFPKGASLARPAARGV
jgi:hypothetical protein